MTSAHDIADHLKEALLILKAYQFPMTQRADMTLAELGNGNRKRSSILKDMAKKTMTQSAKYI